MSSETGELSDEAAKRYFEVATHFLGEDWLLETRDEFFGDDSGTPNHKSPPAIVSQYDRGLEELGYEEPDAPDLLPPDQFSKSTLQFINIGRCVSELATAETYDVDDNKVTDGLPESIQHRLRDDDEWEKVLFELQVAAGYARRSYPVQLIEEGSDPGADIRIPLDKEIRIECKRVDPRPGAAQDRRGISETLFSSLSAQVDREGIAIFELSDIPENAAARKLQHHLPNLSNSTRENHIDLPFGTLHIFPYSEPGLIKQVPKTSTGIPSFSSFARLEVEPILVTKLDLALEDLDNATLETDVQPQNTVIRYRNPLYIGVAVDVQDDYIQPVLNQFQSSLRKFDESNVNILHVDIPNMFEKMSVADIKEIRRRIGGLLWNNGKVTAFALSAEKFDNDEIRGMEFKYAMAYMVNENRVVDFPSGFEMDGIPIEEFIDVIYDQ